MKGIGLSKLIGCVALMLAVISVGCHRADEFKRYFDSEERWLVVCVVDLTGSIEAQAQTAAFETLVLLTKQLHRGDSFTLIPITGDAMNEAQGRIARFKLSDRPEVMDADLKRLADAVKQQVKQLQAEAVSSPYQHSDLLGTVRLVAEELAAAEEGTRRVIVVLSDLVQNDQQYNFKRCPELSGEETAVRLASKLVKEKGKAFREAAVYLGQLRSTDLKDLPPARRDAIRAFWKEYFTQGGAASVQSTTDGSGQLAEFIRRMKEKPARKADAAGEKHTG